MHVYHLPKPEQNMLYEIHIYESSITYEGRASLKFLFYHIYGKCNEPKWNHTIVGAIHVIGLVRSGTSSCLVVLVSFKLMIPSIKYIEFG